MRFVLAAMLGMLAVQGSAAFADEPRDFPVGDKPVLADHYPKTLIGWPGGVTSMADVTYSTIPGYRPMVLDIYMPPREAGPKPLILHIHGGGWIGGHTRHSGALADFPAALAKLASEGFVVASVEYRLADEADFPAQLQDVRAALRYLKGNAAHYGIDPSRAGVWGGSAGGHLAALAALTCGVSGLDPAGTDAAPGSECVQAAVTWYGIFDFAALAASRPGGGNSAAARLLGCKGPCTQKDYAFASPVTYVDAKDPPFLLIHGIDDQVAPVEQSYLLEKKLKAAGVPVEAIYIPGVNHSLIGKTPEATRQATLRATNATFDFFHQVLDGDKK